MAACTFFGPADCPDPIRDRLKMLIVDLILNHDTDTFYVGNGGLFDAMVRCVLWDLRKVYPHIQYHVVPAHRPSDNIPPEELAQVLLPNGIEEFPPQQATDRRDRWMLDHSMFAIIYIPATTSTVPNFQLISIP